MMDFFKKIWNAIVGAAKSLLTALCDTMFDQAKNILKDTDLVNLALNACKAAAIEGLTGEKAWVKARDEFVASAEKAGKKLENSTINFILEWVYDSWKNMGYPGLEIKQ